MARVPLPFQVPGPVGNGEAYAIFNASKDYVGTFTSNANTAIDKVAQQGLFVLTDEMLVKIPDQKDDVPIDFEFALEYYNSIIALLPDNFEFTPSDIPEPRESITFPGFPSPPSAPAGFDTTPPVLGDFVTPPPTLTVSAPTLVPINTDLSEPDYTVPALGTFTVLIPAEPEFAAPDDVSNIEALLDLAVTQLTADMTDGTYGIDSTQEALLWERAKERERLEYQAAIEQVDTFASRGFSRPPGSMNKALAKAQQNYYLKLATANREQTIKRIDLHFDARQKAIASAIQLKAAIQDVNKTLAQIYETRVRAYLGQVEAFKTQEMLKMDSYKAELSGFESKVKAFLGQVEANKSNETTKIESYKAQLSGYETRQKIYLGQIEAFKTEETLKVENYKALSEMYDVKNKIYLGQIEAFKTQCQMAVERMKADIEAYDARVKAYIGKTEVYKTEETVKIEYYKAQINAVEAQIKGLAETYRLRQEAVMEEYRQQMVTLQLNTENAKSALAAASKKADVNMEGAKATADFYKALVASAMSIIHTSATTSASATTNQQSSYQSYNSDNFNSTEYRSGTL